MNYYIQIPSPNKAKNDIDCLFHDMGYANLSPRHDSGNAISRFLLRLAAVFALPISAVFRIATTLGEGDVLCLQYPMKKFFTIACRMAHLKKARVVTIIHDLGAFRRHKLSVDQERRRLSHSDILIVHNERMESHLVKNGSHQPIIRLDIFDYLSNTPPSHKASPLSPTRVVYAGNLARWRNEFLYHLEEETRFWTIDVFGKGFDEPQNSNPHLRYNGMLSPEELVARVDADFGLVWDGGSLDECDGEWGRYLLVNNPHKTSFYLRAGIPVIVWSESAMAPFILGHGLGIAIHSIRELKEILPHMSAQTYAQLKANAKKISEQLGNGYYTRRAFEEAQRLLATNSQPEV